MTIGWPLTSTRGFGAVAWAWGINGYASVISAALATLLAIEFGFGAVVLMALSLYLAAALAFDTVVPTIEIAWVTDILILTIYLFVFEIVSVDVAAICIMVLLGLTSLFAPLMGLQQGLAA